MSTASEENERLISPDGNEGYISRDFGDEPIHKHKATVRIAFQNVNGMGYSTSSVKSNSIRKFIVEKNVDVMALAETNINWGKLRRHQTLPQVCKQWFERSKTTILYNQHQRKSKFKHQPGGTAIISISDMSLRHHKHEYDERKLGRWASQSFQGKQGLTTRVVSVYVPILVSAHGEVR